jgi:pSer/pThr/pTyr-binding forkhead associated (FHA) protein
MPKMPSLWLIPVDASQKTLRIDAPESLVGRDPSCAVQVNDPSVSRRHATLEQDRGNWVVSDQKSANGTWLDGQRVTKAYVRQGQNLRFGAVAFEVSTEDPAARPAPQARPAAAQARPSTPPPVVAPVATPPPVQAATQGLADAAELLGVRVGASRDEVRQHYQRIYNDYQIRLTNAPTAALKRMYQKNLQDLKTAAEQLAPGILAELRA